MTNGLILFYSFATSPSFIKEQEKRENVFLFFIHVYIFCCTKENTQVRAGMRVCNDDVTFGNHRTKHDGQQHWDTL